MNLFSRPGAITVTSNKWLTPYLEQEMAALGYPIDERFVTGVRITGTLTECIRLNLNLRCASQVLYSLKSFKAANTDDIYRELTGFAWEDILPDDLYFSVTSNTSNPTINNSMFANLRVKDAIVDRLREKRGSRPATGAELTGAVIHLFWKDDQAEIFVDSSGDSLARHGYRKIPGRAPMLESLATAVIMASKWDRASPFVNPMCGSGTLAIEAALMATNTMPGLFRNNYAFMHLKGYDESVFLNQRGILENQIADAKGLRIIATDYSAQAIVNARKNAAAAGVDDLIEFSVCDFADTQVPPGKAGVVFFNPEYGERLGAVSELEAVYRRIGDFMKQQCKGYTGYVFTGNVELAKKIGLKAAKKTTFFNGPIDCRLLEYELYAGSRREPAQSA
ncbi:MAG TPA: class I SAM-dependent RNA methyltransferase [Flavitalea sp.]|nr:class I SAM-dependent RNA methyltransferase [Flavitalea sp.]